MWFSFEFIDEIIYCCIEFVCAGRCGHGELGWQEGYSFNWYDGTSGWYVNIVLSVVMHCRSCMPALNASISPGGFSFLFWVVCYAFCTKWAKWVGVEVVQAKDLVAG